jgi:hypothetical protein
MTRNVKPLIAQHGRILNGAYYRDLGDTSTPVRGSRSIPPERIGLNGEYDHYGLVKRVRVSLSHRYGTNLVDRLNIRQRGSVIVLSGAVSGGANVEELAQIILSLEGATQVEVRQLQVTGGQQLAVASA